MNYARLPLSFEANQGQTDRRVMFLSRGSGYTLFLTPTEAVLALSRPQPEERSVDLRQPPPFTHRPPSTRKPVTSVLRMKLLGANVRPEVRGLEELRGKSNCFIGNDPKKWRTNVANYAKVEYKEIYPGVDLAYYGNQRQLEHDFILAPGASPSGITMELKGADKLSLDSQGDLVWGTGGGEVRLQKPVVYQEVEGTRREIAGSYVLKGNHRVGFQLCAYDTSKRLVIDPVLSYSTYLGGSDDDAGLGVALDSVGNAYVTGSTLSTNFPTVSALQSVKAAGYDAFVAKINAAGSAVVYSTYLGGSKNCCGFLVRIDKGFGIAVDSSGNAHVTGVTESTDFPTANAFQPAFGGGGADAFVAKLNAAGSALLYSTYLGGTGDEGGAGIAVDSSGSAYVAGFTQSPNFPTTPGAFQTVYPGGNVKAFVAKLNAAGSALVYSTYLGGSNYEEGFAIAVDASGNAFVTGVTGSTNFPGASSSPIQPALVSPGDAFVAKLNAAGNALVYSTYLGGSGYDEGDAIAVDSSGNAYVTGYTNSANFHTANALQPAFGGTCVGCVGDAFVAKLNPAGSALVYSTYLGGSSFDFGNGIAADASGNAYVTGGTGSTNFPTANALQSTFGGGVGDAFVAKLNAAGSALVYSTYLGGSQYEEGDGIALDASGGAHVTGYTTGSFPTTAGSAQTTYGGGPADAFVAKISEGPADLLNELISTVQSFNLQHGISNSLDVKLENAVDALNAMHAGDITTACNLLSAFISDVQAQSGTALTTDQANQLIALANQVKAALGCP